MSDLLPEPLPLMPGERYVSIMDERVIWPAVVVELRYLAVGMRPEVARAFCDWNELMLLSQDPNQVALADYGDPRDVESDHVYYVDGNGVDVEPAVYRLVWDQDDERPVGLGYDLVIERFYTDEHTRVPRVWIGAAYWMWECANAETGI